MKKLLLILAFFSTVHFVMPPRQGIQGQVFWISGNQMPGPGKIVPAQLGIAREIQVYNAATIRDVEVQGQFYKTINTALVTTVLTKSDGTFKIRLPAGRYSVFTKEPNGLFANIVDQECVSCVTVKPGHFAWLPFTVDYEAVY